MKPVAPNAELSGSAMSSSSGIDTGFSMRMKRAGRAAYCAVVGVRDGRRCGRGAVGGARLVDAHDVVDAADVEQARAFGDEVGVEIERRAACRG